MTRTFEIKVANLDKVIADFSRADKQLPADIYKATVASATMVQNDAKKIGPNSFKNQTGNLRRSIQKKISRPASAVVFTDEKYAIFVEEGTRPHTITAKKAKVLANKKLGIIFGKTVHHRGSRPYPFFKPAFEDNIAKINDMYVKVLDSAVRILRG